jgi:hypothetical protein
MIKNASVAESKYRFHPSGILIHIATERLFSSPESALKGCDQRFHPRQARERYCSQQCRQAARQWSRWKAQQSYRATAAGKEKRNGQNRRYRERVRKRQQPAAQEDARVITKEFFRSLLRPPRLL